MSVYFVQFGPYVKVGYSSNPARRIEQIHQKASNPTKRARHEAFPPLVGWFEPKVLKVISGDRGTESQAHSVMREQRYMGEWFHATPETLSLVENIEAEVAAFVGSVIRMTRKAWVQ